tara:strand:+ start:710 stop:1150 length:441 start_codon:yes stop_codon:yes gene_type:complete
MIIDNLEITGALQISLNNEVVHQCDNLVVTAGKEWVAGRFKDGSIPAEMSHMALGSGSAAAAAGNTALGTELASSRIVLTTDGGTVSNATVQYDATWTSSHGAYAIEEAGIFNAASGGTMLARTVFAIINKGTDDTVTISWTITVS